MFFEPLLLSLIFMVNDYLNLDIFHGSTKRVTSFLEEQHLQQQIMLPPRVTCGANLTIWYVEWTVLKNGTLKDIEKHSFHPEDFQEAKTGICRVQFGFTSLEKKKLLLLVNSTERLI